MSLAILPSSSIHFNRPFTKKPRRCLRTLVNNNQYAVAFKAKTNASQLYNIKPNSGIIEVGKTLNVVITKVAVTEEPPLDVPCTDKFLFESAGISKLFGVYKLDAEFWEKRKKQKRIHHRKIPVEFLPEIETTGGEIVHLYPSRVLRFWGSVTDDLETTLTIDNVSTEPVAYKIMTSNINDFLVYPNMGRIEPLEEHEIIIVRKKAKVDLTRDEIEGVGRADKFRILTTTIPIKHNDSSIDDVFAWADLRPDHKVYSHKLPVRYPDYVGIGENILDETHDPKEVHEKHSDGEKGADIDKGAPSRDPSSLLLIF
ncbi:phosphatidylinositol-binding protein scs2 [Pleurotus ostreatus]|uniref:Phosphatidylinositol-binding protein scs2 n=1 Tax=Pleurotus ostreatus TaxID=5322 RepID=A0A8H6ZUM3_PLEOS|nr:phosphatidylinositol-binding protein scs2 [Pleurotus ostreatus]KAF7431211.1 phosphatidylinositol-binding protein scs2 [Pleurotus ostreatus]KAJ8695673.1 phosphatidylinositol-binding protein scs2, variant 2 [Pleurotus ostreatus]